MTTKSYEDNNNNNNNNDFVDIETGVSLEKTSKSSKSSKKNTSKRKKVDKSGASKKSKKKENTNVEPPKLVDILMDDDIDEESATDDNTENKSIVLSKHEDPFAQRDGKTLIWQNVNMTLVRRLQHFLLIITSIFISHNQFLSTI
jgi:hypothetical protein